MLYDLKDEKMEMHTESDGRVFPATNSSQTGNFDNFISRDR